MTVGRHPLAMRRGELAARGVLCAAELARARDGALVRVGGAVIVRQRPYTAGGMCFMTLEDETGFANIAVTPAAFELQRAVITGSALLEVEGRAQARDGVVTVLAGRCAPLFAAGPRAAVAGLPLSAQKKRGPWSEETERRGRWPVAGNTRGVVRGQGPAARRRGSGFGVSRGVALVLPFVSRFLFTTFPSTWVVPEAVRARGVGRSCRWRALLTGCTIFGTRLQKTGHQLKPGLAR